MDLGISGRKALVGAASEGLGRACAEQLAAEGVDLTIVARREDILDQAVVPIKNSVLEAFGTTRGAVT